MSARKHYNLKKIFIIFFLLLGLGVSTEYSAQSGGRKRERTKKSKGGFSRKKSAGNADEFARKRKGMFSKLFKKDQPAWVYRSSGSKKSHYRDNKALFTRHRAVGKVESQAYLEKQNRKRDRNRNRGNTNFGGKKYKRK